MSASARRAGSEDKHVAVQADVGSMRTSTIYSVSDQDWTRNTQRQKRVKRSERVNLCFCLCLLLPSRAGSTRLDF